MIQSLLKRDGRMLATKSKFRTAIFAPFCCLIIGAASLVNSQEKPIKFGDAFSTEAGVVSSLDLSDESLPASSLELVDAIYQTFNSNHISPPAKQQFYLSAARAIYQLGSVSPPRDLAERFSDLNTMEQLNSLLHRSFSSSVGDKNPVIENEAEFNQQLGLLLVSTIDPASQFITTKELKVRKQVLENRYVGIGIRISYDKDLELPEIFEPFPGGPAKKAGSRPGDFILDVDGKSTHGVELGEVVQWLRGENGTNVTVTLRNRDDKKDKQREYTMTRAEVPFDTVKGVKRRDDDSWIFQLEQAEDIGYLKFDSIVGSTPAELAAAWRHVSQDNFAGIVLDLSNVTDAEVHNVTLLADQLLPETRLGIFNDGINTRELKTGNDHLEIKKPVVVFSAANVSGPIYCLMNELSKRPGVLVVPAHAELITSNSLCRKMVEVSNDLGAIDGMAYATCKPLLVAGAISPNRSSHDQPKVTDLNSTIEWIRGKLGSE